MFTAPSWAWPVDLYISVRWDVIQRVLKDQRIRRLFLDMVDESDIRCVPAGWPDDLEVSLWCQPASATDLGQVLNAVFSHGMQLTPQHCENMEVVFRCGIPARYISRVVTLSKTNKAYKQDRYRL